MALEWRGQYRNTLDGSRLEIGIGAGTPPRYGRSFFNREFGFDRNQSGVVGWERSQKEFIPSHQMADYCLKLLMDFTHERHMQNKR